MEQVLVFRLRLFGILGILGILGVFLGFHLRILGIRGFHSRICGGLIRLHPLLLRRDLRILLLLLLLLRPFLLFGSYSHSCSHSSC